METLRYRLLNNWNLIRVIRLVMGLIIGAQALPTVACRWPCWQRYYSCNPFSLPDAVPAAVAACRIATE
jgi:hypothetical protein